MKDESTTFGLSPKKVVDLLNIGTEAGAAASDTNQQKADLLSDRLSETLPLYYSTEEKSSKRLRRLRQTIGVLAGEPIGKLLQDPKTDITVIRMTKGYGRKLSTRAKFEVEHQTANTIYYAAIAHALVCHDLKITKYSYTNMQQSFCHLSKENWIPKGLLDLFTKASEYCKARVK
jgi:hypothetical protein